MVHEFSKKKYIKIVIWRYILIWFFISFIWNFIVYKNEKLTVITCLLFSSLIGIVTFLVANRKVEEIKSSRICTYDGGNITYEFTKKNHDTYYSFVKMNKIYEKDIYQINQIKKFIVKSNYIVVYANVIKSKVSENVILKGKKKDNLTQIEIPRVFEKEEEFLNFLRENTIKEV